LFEGRTCSGQLEIVNIAGEGARHVEIAFDERSVYHELRLDIRELETPGFDLLTQRAEMALDAIDADRQGIHH